MTINLQMILYLSPCALHLSIGLCLMGCGNLDFLVNILCCQLEMKSREHGISIGVGLVRFAELLELKEFSFELLAKNHSHA